MWGAVHLKAEPSQHPPSLVQSLGRGCVDIFIHIWIRLDNANTQFKLILSFDGLKLSTIKLKSLKWHLASLGLGFGLEIHVSSGEAVDVVQHDVLLLVRRELGPHLPGVRPLCLLCVWYHPSRCDNWSGHGWHIDQNKRTTFTLKMNILRKQPAVVTFWYSSGTWTE